MKKIFALCLCLLCLMGAMTACGEDAGTAYLEHNGYKMISNPEIVEYYLYMPDYWTADNATGITSAYYNQDRCNISVTAYEGTAYESAAAQANAETWQSLTLPQKQKLVLQEFWKKYEADAKAIYQMEYTKAEDESLQYEKEGHLGGQYALAYEFQSTFQEMEYKTTQVICIYDSRIFLFTYMGPTANGYYDNHSNEVADMLRIFSFVQKG